MCVCVCVVAYLFSGEGSSSDPAVLHHPQPQAPAGMGHSSPHHETLFTTLLPQAAQAAYPNPHSSYKHIHTVHRGRSSRS